MGIFLTVLPLAVGGAAAVLTMDAMARLAMTFSIMSCGDEFALIVSADMDEGQRARMAERIQTTLSAPVVLDGTELSVGVSCGCACYPEDGDASQVRITADSRMYAEKQHHHEDDRTEEQS